MVQMFLEHNLQYRNQLYTLIKDSKHASTILVSDTIYLEHRILIVTMRE